MPGKDALGARLVAVALTATALTALAPAAADAGSKRTARYAASCKNAHATAATASVSSVRHSTLCLVNAERRSRGLPRLRHNSRLRRAAERHARDMVRRGYFSHDTPSGTDFVQRVVRARYVTRRSANWLLGENLAWGSGSRSSARNIMRAWMRSQGHRRNILRRGFREIGIGIVRGAPVDGVEESLTYVTEFGTRRRR